MSRRFYRRLSAVLSITCLALAALVLINAARAADPLTAAFTPVGTPAISSAVPTLQPRMTSNIVDLRMLNATPAERGDMLRAVVRMASKNATIDMGPFDYDNGDKECLKAPWLRLRGCGWSQTTWRTRVKTQSMGQIEFSNGTVLEGFHLLMDTPSVNDIGIACGFSPVTTEVNSKALLIGMKVTGREYGIWNCSAVGCEITAIDSEASGKWAVSLYKSSGVNDCFMNLYRCTITGDSTVGTVGGETRRAIVGLAHRGGTLRARDCLIRAKALTVPNDSATAPKTPTDATAYWAGLPDKPSAVTPLMAELVNCTFETITDNPAIKLADVRNTSGELGKVHGGRLKGSGPGGQVNAQGPILPLPVAPAGINIVAPIDVK